MEWEESLLGVKYGVDTSKTLLCEQDDVALRERRHFIDVEDDL